MLCTIESFDPLMVCFLTDIFIIFVAYLYMCLNNVVYCATICCAIQMLVCIKLLKIFKKIKKYFVL